MLDSMKLVTALKQGDAYEYEKQYESTGPQLPVILPGRLRGASAMVTGEWQGEIEITLSSLFNVDSDKATWHAIFSTEDIAQNPIVDIPRCQAIRLNIKSGHPKMEIYAS
jgi:hypothetical protein